MKHTLEFSKNLCVIVDRDDIYGVMARFDCGEDALVPIGLTIDVCRLCDKYQGLRIALKKMGYKVKLSKCNQHQPTSKKTTRRKKDTR